MDLSTERETEIEYRLCWEKFNISKMILYDISRELDICAFIWNICLCSSLAAFCVSFGNKKNPFRIL